MKTVNDIEEKNANSKVIINMKNVINPCILIPKHIYTSDLKMFHSVQQQ